MQQVSPCLKDIRRALALAGAIRFGLDQRLNLRTFLRTSSGLVSVTEIQRLQMLDLYVRRLASQQRHKSLDHPFDYHPKIAKREVLGLLAA